MDECGVKELLLQRSNIGFGFDPDGEDGPRFTSRQVVADYALSRIAFTYKEECGQEVQLTYSARAADYLSAGWADTKVAAKSPWADAGIKVSESNTFDQSERQNYVYVTGQYNFTFRKLSLKDSSTQLQPHPEFNQAILNALATRDESERAHDVRRVLNSYGTMFPISVEMGGRKYATIKTQLDGRVGISHPVNMHTDGNLLALKDTEASVRKEMSITLGRNFGVAEVQTEFNLGSDYTWIPFRTVGGAIEATSFVKWRESLASPRRWTVIKVLEVESVLTLFDKETRLKIATAVSKAPVPYISVATAVSKPPSNAPIFPPPSPPKVPLYQFRNNAGRHCLSTDPDVSKIPVTSDGAWTNQGSLGMVFKSPFEDAVPLYHLYNGQRHLFTTSDAEKRRESGFRDQGIICYVHTTERPGTILIRRMLNDSWGDNVYARPNEVDEQRRWGYNPEDARYYLYTA
ncbi:hypothetical protein FS837_009447 [Tulasnella sp. UAMH 9824]|nr:hypothetical protein FS837_009447 [Tulasnella sp. UAMH 9824]